MEFSRDLAKVGTKAGTTVFVHLLQREKVKDLPVEELNQAVCLSFQYIPKRTAVRVQTWVSSIHPPFEVQF